MSFLIFRIPNLLFKQAKSPIKTYLTSNDIVVSKVYIKTTVDTMFQNPPLKSFYFVNLEQTWTMRNSNTKLVTGKQMQFELQICFAAIILSRPKVSKLV